MTSNWDDDFDFDDIGNKPKPKKQVEIKKVKKNDDDFFDLDEEIPSNNNKLPVIAKKSQEIAISPKDKKKDRLKSKNNYEDYEEIEVDIEEMKSPQNLSPVQKKNQKLAFNAEFEDIESLNPKKEEKIIKVGQNKKNATIQKKLLEQDEQFYQSIEEVKEQQASQKKDNLQKKVTKQIENKIENENEIEQNYDDYGEDFEDIEDIQAKQTNKQINKKSNTTANLKQKDKNIKETEKKQTSSNAIKSNKIFINKDNKNQGKTASLSIPTIPKPQTKENTIQKKSTVAIKQKFQLPVPVNKKLVKSDSKKSLQSNGSKKNLSLSRASAKNNNSEFIPNRHINLVNKQFPDTQGKLNELNNDKINRLNEQIREMIRKFNEQLNDLINKNMILLKEKPIEKNISVDERVKILQEQLKNGATALEVIQNEYSKLRGREGELRQEQYQLILERKMEEVRQSIKETSKAIVKLKYEVNSEGNKLSKQEVEKKWAQQLHQLKTMLVQTKKDEQKNEQKLCKLDQMIEELDSKNSDKQYELSEQIDTAKDKGIQIGLKEETRKKYEDLKTKLLNLQNHKRAVEGLSKVKCQNIVHQNDQIKNSIKNIESEINNMYTSIDVSHEEAIKLVKKAKENSKISTGLVQNLNKLLKSLEESQINHINEVRTQGNKSQVSHRPLKNSTYENISQQTNKPTRNSSSRKDQSSVGKAKQNQIINDDINIMKPNFMKKKDKKEQIPINQEEETNKLYERVWNQQEQKKKQQKGKQQKQKDVLIPVSEEDKKKPFIFKKNKTSQNKITEKNQLIIHQKNQKPHEEAKQEEKSSIIAPKFMKFNRKDKTDQNKGDLSIERVNQNEKKSLEIQQQKPKEQDQPFIIPKRLNLRNKLEKKQDIYMPTLDKNTPQLSKPVQKEQKKQEYVPKQISKEEDIYRPNKINIIDQKLEESIKQTEQKQFEQKPKFNLRLRDRQKKDVQNNDYVPSRITQANEVNESKRKNQQSYNPFSRKQETKNDKYSIFSKDQSIQKTIPISQKSKEQESYFPTQPKDQIKNKNLINDYFSKNNQTNVTNPIKNNEFNIYAKENSNKPSVIAQEAVINNPYAPKQDIALKREREGPVKKIKIQKQVQKQNFNIYDQAEDITDKINPINQPTQVNQNLKPITNLNKTDQIDLNAMLGIKKQQKKTDIDDLLIGEIKIDKKKTKKRNDDFFNDLEI